MPVQLTPDAARRTAELGISGTPKADAYALADKVSRARQTGYSDDDIVQHMATQPLYAERVKRALDAGYAPAEIVSHAGTSPAGYTPTVAPSGAGGQPAFAENAFAGALAGVGAGVGKVALGAQEIAGRGLRWAGADRVGPWLIDDAVRGRANLENEVSPYKEGSPIATRAGEFGGEMAATLPVGGALGKVVGIGAPTLGRAIASGGFGAEAGNVATRMAGGAITGGVSGAMLDPSLEGAARGAIAGGVVPGVVGAAKGIARGMDWLPGPEAMATRQAMTDVGLVTPRLEMNALGNAAMRKNAARLPDLVRTEAGLASGSPLTREAVDSQIRGIYRQAVEPMAQAGNVTHGGALRRALDTVETEIAGKGGKLGANMRPDISELVAQNRLPANVNVPAAEVAGAVANLRRGANAAFDSGDAAMGRAQRAIADAWEETLGLNLRAQGKEGAALFDTYKAAQPQIAKLYATKKLLTPGTDVLDTGALASQLNNGAPLTGNLDTIARATNLYGTGNKTAPLWQRGMPYYGIGSVAGWPHAAAAAGLSMAARRALLNDPRSALSRTLANPVVDVAIGAGADALGSLSKRAPAVLANGLFGQ